MNKQEFKEIILAIDEYNALLGAESSEINYDLIEELEEKNEEDEQELLDMENEPHVRFSIWKQVLVWFVVFLISVFVL